MEKGVGVVASNFGALHLSAYIHDHQELASHTRIHRHILRVMNNQLPGNDVLQHIVDVHCHPTDEIEVPEDVMSALEIKVCAMSSRFDDQQRVSDLALKFPDKVRRDYP
jgi:hypothetical protein